MRSNALILAAVGLGLLASCDREGGDRAPVPPAAGDTSAAAAPAGAAAPFVYESTTPYAEVALELPQQLAGHPQLHASLYQALVRDLRTFNEGAQGEMTEGGAPTGGGIYNKTISVAPAAETPRLVSLVRQDYEFTGGAHGNTVSRGILWDKSTARQLPASALFRPDADLNQLNRTLCAGVNAAKRERGAGAEPVVPDGETWSCPIAAETPFVLAPGTGGRAGGLTFLIGPYIVGPYVEGGYEVRVPTSAIAPLLDPAFADQFG